MCAHVCAAHTRPTGGAARHAFTHFRRQLLQLSVCARVLPTPQCRSAGTHSVGVCRGVHACGVCRRPSAPVRTRHACPVRARPACVPVARVRVALQAPGRLDSRGQLSPGPARRPASHSRLYSAMSLLSAVPAMLGPGLGRGASASSSSASSGSVAASGTPGLPGGRGLRLRVRGTTACWWAGLAAGAGPGGRGRTRAGRTDRLAGRPGWLPGGRGARTWEIAECSLPEGPSRPRCLPVAGLPCPVPGGPKCVGSKYSCGGSHYGIWGDQVRGTARHPTWPEPS